MNWVYFENFWVCGLLLGIKTSYARMWDHVLKSIVQNIQYGMNCVVWNSVLLKLHVFGSQIIQFRPKVVSDYRSIVLTVASGGLSNVFLKDIWTNEDVSLSCELFTIFIVTCHLILWVLLLSEHWQFCLFTYYKLASLLK